MSHSCFLGLLSHAHKCEQWRGVIEISLMALTTASVTTAQLPVPEHAHPNGIDVGNLRTRARGNESRLIARRASAKNYYTCHVAIVAHPEWVTSQV